MFNLFTSSRRVVSPHSRVASRISRREGNHDEFEIFKPSRASRRAFERSRATHRVRDVIAHVFRAFALFARARARNRVGHARVIMRQQLGVWHQHD
jgi:hypothetical protein